MEFLRFVLPFEEQLNSLSVINDIQTFRRDDVRNNESILNGIFRDLRGLLLTFTQQPTYSYFTYPFIPILFKGVEANYDNAVSNVMLKFTGALVDDKYFRISKEINETSSPNGILLFRQTSKLITSYARIAISRKVPNSSKWKEKYKGFAYTFKIIADSLEGKYCNFGVFELFNDTSLKDALDSCFQMMISIPMEDILAFPKLTEFFLKFLKSVIRLLQNRFMLVDQSLQDQNVLAYIVRILGEGIKLSGIQMGSGGMGSGKQESIYNECCEISDHLSTFLFKQSTIAITQPTKPQSVTVRLMNEYPQLLQFLLAKLLETLFFDDRASQYTLSKPLLPLILLNKEYFDFYANKVISFQPPERQEQLAK
ncbi:Exportin 7, partial [Nowakowskiella sp. JEL0078]